MKEIRKAVIPVAGFGTRFLPATKAQPKEMLPIVDKPAIQYIVEGCVAAGIKDIIIVTSSNKRAVEDHFDYSSELEKWLIKQKKIKQLQEIRRIAKLANFIYIRQKGHLGNGTPVLNAEAIIGNEPFAVFWGDEFYQGKTSWIKQMIKVYQKYHDPVLAVTKTDAEGQKRYGIIDGLEVEKNIYQIKRVVEKPGPKLAPSKLAIIGGQILTPDIFPLLKKLKPGKNGEVWLVDAIQQLSQKRTIYAKKIEGKLYDAGNLMGWLKANIELSLTHQDIKEEFRKYLKKLKV
ncbi:UTP--glucose-1-phosphate uridylyltransferase GalU [Patescibacteria group bacterium]|nr:UTP--glucose-1-phosphate uridylyltransferase GalU [Patescibacteria group bacterium]